MSEAGRYRVHARRAFAPHALRAIIWHPRAGWQEDAEVRSAGLGGVGIALEGSLAAGDIVTVAFAAPPLSGRLPIEARVAWVAGQGDGGDGARAQAGLAFMPRDPAALLALFELLAAPDAT